MRMFLVGMCDTFLILYLTVMQQTGTSANVSPLTVADYTTLEEETETLEEKLEAANRLLAEKNEELARIAAAAADADKKAAAISGEKQAALEELAKLEQQTAEARRRYEEQQQLAELQLKELRSAAETAEARQRRLGEEITTLRTKSAAELADARKAMEEARRREQEAAEKARAAEEAAKKSLAEAEQAKEQAAAALQSAAEADERAREANLQRRQAVASAEQARVERRDALIQEAAARAKAAAAQKEKGAMQSKVAAITQPAGRAYFQNVQGKTLLFTVKTRRSALIGSRSNERTLRGVPVLVEGQHLAFIALEQLGLEPRAKPDDFLEFEVAVGNNTVSALYVSPREPAVAALVLPPRKDHGRLVLTQAGLREVMPTLIALRNNTPLGFFDDLRDVSSDYFVFKRDDLKANPAGLLTYEAEGIRGTGDYAQYLLKGDTIVDLNGDLVGLAATNRTVVPIRGITGWKRVELRGKPAEKAVAEIYAALD